MVSSGIEGRAQGRTNMEQWQRAVEYSNKTKRDEFLQGLALLAIAEAIHRLAAAIEQQGSPPQQR